MQSAHKTRVIDQHLHQELQRIILDNDISIQLQPIVSLENNETIGYEVMTRGPLGSKLENAYDMFLIASKYGLSDDLEYAILVTALNIQHHLPNTHFLSIDIGSSLFLSKIFSEITNLCQHIAHQIVFKLTEHVPFTEIAFLEERIKGLQEVGYRISLDDTEGGFSDIERARKLKPSMVKLSLATVARITSNEADRARFNSIFSDLHANQVVLQAEGIEQPEQISKLIELGITLGQGCLFGNPSLPTEISSPNH